MHNFFLFIGRNADAIGYINARRGLWQARKMPCGWKRR